MSKGIIERAKRRVSAMLRELRLRYYQTRGKRTFIIGDNKIDIKVGKYRDARELRYVYETERALRDKILAELRPNDVFWDVGANLGFYSLLAANHPGVNVIAFEPHPYTVKKLRENMALNKRDNVRVMEVALSDSEGRARFDPVEPDTSIGRARLACEGNSRIIEVDTSSGDRLIETGIVFKPDIVKIDVEGAEHLVIKGMKNALQNTRVLFCEIHPDIKSYGSSAEDLERTLEAAGFNSEKIEERGDGTYNLLARRSFKEI